MFGTVDHPARRGPRVAGLNSEPYVNYFDIHSKEQSTFVLPFQMMGYCLCFFVLLGLYFVLFRNEPSVGAIVVWVFCIFAPFYLPGIYHYSRYRDLDQATQLEVDSRHQLIKYCNDQKGENLLFHASQVANCKVFVSILFPYRIDRMAFHLQGGKEIHVSGLIASPQEILNTLELSYKVERRWFNPVPRVVKG